MSGAGHTHGRRRGTEDDAGPFDWFNVLDIAVWASIVVIAVIGIEWLIGHVIRESLASGASKYLRKATDVEAPPPAA